MEQFKRIVYLCDVNANDVGAAKQVLSLARNSNAKLHVWIVNSPLPQSLCEYTDVIETGIRSKARQQYELCCNELRLDPQSIDTEFAIVAAAHPAITIINKIIEIGADLLIKAAQVSGDNKEFTALDMSLLRLCPIPVWLCQPVTYHHNKISVAVAIDASDESMVSKTLNQKIISFGNAVALDCNSKLNIVSCWEFELETLVRDSVWLNIAQDDLLKQINEAEQIHRRQIDSSLGRTDVEQCVHQIKGKPELVIPPFVNDKDIDILIMGSVASTGIPGLIIGNTAENLFNKLGCTLIALKPDEFVSPVR